MVENVYVAAEDDPTAPILPCSDGKGGTVNCAKTGYESTQPKFVFGGNSRYSASHSKQFGVYVLAVPIQKTHVIKSGLTGPKNLEFYNGKGGVIKFTGALHWAWAGNSAYIFLKEGGSSKKFNAAFKKGDTLSVRMTPDWEHPEDNLALAFVYGKDKEYSSGQRFSGALRRGGRVRFGSAGNPQRDFEVFTINAFVMLQQGYTYTFQQYVVTGRYVEQHKTVTPFVDATAQHVRLSGAANNGAHKNRRGVSVVANGDGAFAAVLTASLLPGCGEVICTGDTSAQRKGSGNNGISRPFFAVTCGEKVYFGEDMYHFAPGPEDSVVELGGTNDNNAKNLKACTGECEDGQCAAGLKCFQRDGYTPILGCSGKGQ